MCDPQLYFGVAYYARKVTRPLLWIRRGSTTRFFGFQYLRASDVIRDRDLITLNFPFFWVIGRNPLWIGGDAENWLRSCEMTSEVSFEGDDKLFPRLVVQHFSRRVALVSLTHD